ncbi:hypothetical protein CVV65_15740 [Kyrpidia spormannii]|uniref:Uncharacterized protein n=1 Tax=Kyrpidia spormannii TaxID=2055160 RepID=A0A2K8NA41_9BACL|nr:hypothetical protein CVV65_15740 [Kyrpidia spormannii]
MRTIVTVGAIILTIVIILLNDGTSLSNEARRTVFGIVQPIMNAFADPNSFQEIDANRYLVDNMTRIINLGRHYYKYRSEAAAAIVVIMGVILFIWRYVIWKRRE